MTLGIRKTFYLGDLNQDGRIDEDDYDILYDFVNGNRGLTNYQKKLADLTQTGGDPTIADLNCLRAFIDLSLTQRPDGSYYTPVGDLERVGYTGAMTASTVETLEGFTVKLYILRTSDYDNMSEEFDDNYASMIISDLREYKVLPLDIIVDLHSIKKYYWSLKGRYVTKTPLSKDELQNITIKINNYMRYVYAPEKINFNEVPSYKDVMELILGIDNRILMVDIDPFVYVDENGEEVSKEVITGRYTQVVKKLDDINEANNLHYTITLDKAPVLPRFCCN